VAGNSQVSRPRTTVNYHYQPRKRQFFGIERSMPHFRQRRSLSAAKRDIVVMPGCRRTIRGTIMSFAIQHVHVKTKDPKQTMQFYIDNLGATYVAEIPGRGHRLNLHGLTLNITTLISAQNHEQHYGIEHIALDTDDYSGAMTKLRENGVRVLEELPPNNGRRVCFLEAPDGAQIELIEKVKAA
jgi:catechol 2,3-dioxygenase-like lactoylglutathione lyase family enzyme